MANSQVRKCHNNRILKLKKKNSVYLNQNLLEKVCVFSLYLLLHQWECIGTGVCTQWIVS